MYQSRDLERISKNVVAQIEEELSRAGILFRIFYRVKSWPSMNTKLKKTPGYYDGINKFVRDTLGIRVVLYFSDDLELVYKHLRDFFTLIEETIDKHDETKFAPTRINLVFGIPEPYIKEFRDIVKDPVIDCTFELQIRTILSEGWHEIDHDLRYKCKEDWSENNDVARNFNGIFASLETSEYSILRLFEQLSYRHYRKRNVSAMLRTKYRLRFISEEISENLRKSLSKSFLRAIFKIDRSHLLHFLFKNNIVVPLTLDNLIFILNYQFIGNIEILAVTPEGLVTEIRNAIETDSQRQKSIAPLN